MGKYKYRIILHLKIQLMYFKVYMYIYRTFRKRTWGRNIYVQENIAINNIFQILYLYIHENLIWENIRMRHYYI